MEIKKIEAKGNYVVLKLIEKEDKDPYKKKGQLFVPEEEKSSGQRELERAEIYHLGPKVDPELGLSVGQTVVFNEYDIKYVGGEQLYGLTQDSSIMAVYEREPEPEEESSIIQND